MRNRLAVLSVVILAALAAAPSASTVPIPEPTAKNPAPAHAMIVGLRDRVGTIRARKCLGARDWKRPAAAIPKHRRHYVVHGHLAVLERTKARPRLCTTRELGAHLAAKLYGWTGYQWDALEAMWSRESGWNVCAHYPSTINCAYRGPNACGIPQANPCSKMCGGLTLAACGARRMIRWGLGYIAGRYGTPAGAWAYWQSASAY